MVCACVERCYRPIYHITMLRPFSLCFLGIMALCSTLPAAKLQNYLHMNQRRLRKVSSEEESCIYNKKINLCSIKSECRATSPSEGHYIIYINKNIALSDKSTIYDVYGYRLHEEEKADDITLEEVLKNGNLCSQAADNSKINHAIEFQSCDYLFDAWKNKELEIYSYISANSSCKHHSYFVLFDSTVPSIEKTSTCQCNITNSHCIYVRGSYICECDDGYSLEDDKCEGWRPFLHNLNELVNKHTPYLL